MSELLIIKLTNMSPLHIGKGRDSYDVASPVLASDSLSAALAAILAQSGHGGDIKAFLESFAVSSAFPYAGDTLFLPKPAGRLDVGVIGQSEEQYRKKLKKVQWVAWSAWTQLVEAKHIDVAEGQLHGAFLLDKATDDFNAPMKHEIHQRVSVPRCDNSDAKPFTFDWTFFRPDCGLYCIVQANDDTQPHIIDLFNELGEQGIGSDRSVGGGHFEVSTCQMQLPQVDHGDATMLLSSYLPSADELKAIDLGKSRYSIVRRGGFIAGGQENVRHLRRNTIHMFATGSVLHCSAPIGGRVVDLRPQVVGHPVLRSGRPICVTIKTQPA